MSRHPVHPGLVKSHYPVLSGRDWIKRIAPEDRLALGELGRLAQRERGVNWHAEGGKVRAQTARRDAKGRFIQNDDRTHA